MNYEAEKLRGAPIFQETYLKDNHQYTSIKSKKNPLRNYPLVRLIIIDVDVPASGPNKVSLFDSDSWN